MTHPHPDILIVGGGVIGLTTAWYASGMGARVTVVDQGEIGKQASWAGAGIISPVQAQWGRFRHGWTQLRGLSFDLWPKLSAELRDASGIDNHFLVCGGVEVPPFGDLMARVPTKEWFFGGVRQERVWRDRLREIEPLLDSAFPTAAYLPDLAQVRNPRHLRALATACAGRGVRLLPNWPVLGLARVGPRVVAVDSHSGRLFADRILLASGAWTDRLLKEQGITLGVKPIRGQMVLFNTSRTGAHPVLMQGSRYLVPRLDGRVLAGSTEEDVGFDTRTTEEGIGGLIDFARRLVPSLAHAPIETTWAGLRPGSPDGQPYLGFVPGVENLYVAAGHFRSGIQLSPGTGLVMAQVLTGRERSIDLAAFALDRARPSPTRGGSEVGESGRVAGAESSKPR
jgi:glycine oxidase